MQLCANRLLSPLFHNTTRQQSKPVVVVSPENGFQALVNEAPIDRSPPPDPAVK